MTAGPFTPTIRGYTEATSVHPTDAVEIDRVGVGTMWIDASLLGGALFTFQGGGIPSSGAWLGSQPFPTPITFPAEWGGASNLFAWVLPTSLPTAPATFTIKRATLASPAGTTVGTVTIATDGSITGSTSGLAVDFPAASAMVVTCPNPADATLADFSFAFLGAAGVSA